MPFLTGTADGSVRLLDSSGQPTTGIMAGVVEMFIGYRLATPQRKVYWV